MAALDADALVNTIVEWSGTPVPRVAVGINANVAYLARSDRTFLEALRAADLPYADGQSVVWAARAAGHPVPERIATTDLIDPLARAAVVAGRRMFFLGGRPGVAAKAAEVLCDQHPGLVVATMHGYTRTEDAGEVLDLVHSHGTDILLVGMGDPMQQQWVRENLPRLRVGAVLTCGGLFDWVSGSNPRAPRWMIRAGLEWLWRLGIEPRRLARRYVFGNSWFVRRVAVDLVRRRFASTV